MLQEAVEMGLFKVRATGLEVAGIFGKSEGEIKEIQGVKVGKRLNILGENGREGHIGVRKR